MLDLMVFDNDTTNIPSLNHIMDYYTRKYKKLKAIKIVDEQSIHCKVVFNKMILIAWFLAHQKHFGFRNFIYLAIFTFFSYLKLLQLIWFQFILIKINDFCKQAIKTWCQIFFLRLTGKKIRIIRITTASSSVHI